MNPGQPFGAPPPLPIRPQRSAGTNCLIAGGVGCAILILIMIIVTVVALSKTPHLMSTFSNLGNGTVACKQKLTEIDVALTRYEQKHNGKYPAKLSELVPDYLPDSSALTYQASPSTPKQTVVYSPPSKGQTGQVVVAKYLVGTIDLSALGQKQEIFECLTNSHTIVQQQVVDTQTPGN